jgi:hypothetical protein
MKLFHYRASKFTQLELGTQQAGEQTSQLPWKPVDSSKLCTSIGVILTLRSYKMTRPQNSFDMKICWSKPEN